jgi:hypothetical protein
LIVDQNLWGSLSHIPLALCSFWIFILGGDGLWEAASYAKSLVYAACFVAKPDPPASAE